MKLTTVGASVSLEMRLAFSNLRGFWSANGDFTAKEEGGDAESGVSATISPSPSGRNSAGPKFVFDSSHQCRELACHTLYYTLEIWDVLGSLHSRSGQKNNQSLSHAESPLKFVMIHKYSNNRGIRNYIIGVFAVTVVHSSYATFMPATIKTPITQA